MAAIDRNSPYYGAHIALTVATVVLSWERELKPDMAKVNPWGGAIAHGHPVGATGSILMAKLLSGLDSIDGQFGLQVMCAGHGMATCTIIERL